MATKVSKPYGAAPGGREAAPRRPLRRDPGRRARPSGGARRAGGAPRGGTGCVSGVGGESPLPGACLSAPAAGGREGRREKGAARSRRAALGPRRGCPAPPSGAEGSAGQRQLRGRGKLLSALFSRPRPSARSGCRTEKAAEGCWSRSPGAPAPLPPCPGRQSAAAAGKGLGRRRALPPSPGTGRGVLGGCPAGLGTGTPPSPRPSRRPGAAGADPP